MTKSPRATQIVTKMIPRHLHPMAAVRSTRTRMPAINRVVIGADTPRGVLLRAGVVAGVQESLLQGHFA